jgi:hypothetical protein
MRHSSAEERARPRAKSSLAQGRLITRKKKIISPSPRPTGGLNPPPLIQNLRHDSSAALPCPPQKRELIWSENLSPEEQFCISVSAPDIPWTGSRRLLLGVLQDALRSFFQYHVDRTRIGKRIFNETQTWIWSSKRNWLYSFENICAHLHLDPDYLRQGLQQFLQTTRSTVTNPKRSVWISRRRPFHLISGPGTRISKKTPASIPRRNVR